MRRSGMTGDVSGPRNMYMVNRIAAYRYFARMEEPTKTMTRNQKYMKLWGQWLSKD